MSPILLGLLAWGLMFSMFALSALVMMGYVGAEPRKDLTDPIRCLFIVALPVLICMKLFDVLVEAVKKGIQR